VFEKQHRVVVFVGGEDGVDDVGRRCGQS
jgi:hypothetical protein